MHILGLFSVSVPADDVAASRQWWQDELGLLVNEDDAGALDIGDATIRFGERGVRLVAAGLEEGPLHLVDPAGTVIDVVEPDYEAGRQAEASIRDFIDAQSSLAGPPVDDLVDAVSAIMDEAHARVAALIADVPHNKVLATQLAFSQRARDVMPDERQWPLHAASTLMSGFIIAGAQDGG